MPPLRIDKIELRMPQNAPQRINFFSFLGGACPRTPLGHDSLRSTRELTPPPSRSQYSTLPPPCPNVWMKHCTVCIHELFVCVKRANRLKTAIQALSTPMYMCIHVCVVHSAYTTYCVITLFYFAEANPEKYNNRIRNRFFYTKVL